MSRKLLYLVTEDWYFCSHRLPLARAAVEAGYDVGVITQVTGNGELIRQAGLKLFPVPFARSARKPLQDLRTILSIIRIYRRERPDLVHHVSIKPIVYGSFAAWCCRVPAVINAYTGLGFLFTSGQASTKTALAILTRLWRPFLVGDRRWSIVQNADDRAVLLQRGLLREDRTVLIRGSGVDLAQYVAAPEMEGVPLVVFASRLLWDKGIAEYVAAARRLKAKGLHARFAIVGEPDDENPMAVPLATLNLWQQEGCIEWWGRRNDMPEVFRQAHIVCLPSYREGLPKVLLEAAACARPIVTTDTPGCRDVVRHGENGLLVPARDAAALADAIGLLLADSARRRAMGENARRIVEAEFSIDTVIQQTLSAYRTVLGSG